MTLESNRGNPAIRARMDYGFARARDLAFDAVSELWRKRQAAGMKQTDLAEKLGRDTGWLSKKLKGPGNWTLRTFGEMAEALDGEIEIRIHPLEEPAKERINYDAYAAEPSKRDQESKLIQRRQSAATYPAPINLSDER